MENDKNLFPTDSLPDYLNQVIGHFKEVFEYDINAQALSSVVNCASLIDSRTTSNFKGKVQRPIFWSCIIQETGTAKSNLLASHTEFLMEKSLGSTEANTIYIADESTYEALLKYSENNTRGILMTIDELPTWIKGMDNYSSNGNKSRMMSLWNPKPVQLLRKGEPPVPIKHHKVNLLAYTQPTKIAELFKSDDIKDGFANRFLFAEQYDTGFRFENDKKLEHRYASLLNVPYNRIWNVKPTEFIFDKEAIKCFSEWYNRQGVIYTGYKSIIDYLPKLSTYGIRLAVVLHLMEFSELTTKEPKKEISSETINRVCKLLEFFIEQYKRMLDNRYQNYEQQVLDEQRPEFIKCYRTLSEEKSYQPKDLEKIFVDTNVVSRRQLYNLFKTALFRKEGKRYEKTVPNE